MIHTFCLDCVLDVESESFTLANVMEAPLLKNKEDVEVTFLYTFHIFPLFSRDSYNSKYLRTFASAPSKKKILRRN